MKAILIIPEQEATACPSAPCLCLFPILDRPFLQHIVEAMANRGVKEVQIVVGQGADAIEEFLGDGTRWGCSFSYHLSSNPGLDRVLPTVTSDDELVVIAHAEQLPELPSAFPTAGPGVLFGTPAEWSGWAVVPVRDLIAWRRTAPLAVAQFFASRGAIWTSAGRSVMLRSLADVPAAQRAFLLEQVPGVLVAAREKQPGVWMARNAWVAPTATVRPPVFIGENAAIGPEVQLGPFAVVGAACMLDHNSQVSGTTVCEGTYVGAGVKLDGVIVDGRCLVNPQQLTATAIDRRWLDRLVPSLPFSLEPTRALVAAAFVLSLPVILAAALWLRLTRRGPVFWSRHFVRPGISPAESTWESSTVYTLVPPRHEDAEYGWVIPATFRGLVLELLPSLGAVAVGNLRLVGLPPRSRELLRTHAAQCPSVVRMAPGLISEVALCRFPMLTPTDRILVDAYQTQTPGGFANLRRVFRFLFGAFTCWGVTRSTNATDGSAPDERVANPAEFVLAPIVDLSPVVTVDSSTKRPDTNRSDLGVLRSSVAPDNHERPSDGPTLLEASADPNAA